MDNRNRSQEKTRGKSEGQGRKRAPCKPPAQPQHPRLPFNLLLTNRASLILESVVEGRARDADEQTAHDRRLRGVVGHQSGRLLHFDLAAQRREVEAGLRQPREVVGARHAAGQQLASRVALVNLLRNQLEKRTVRKTNRTATEKISYRSHSMHSRQRPCTRSDDDRAVLLVRDCYRPAHTSFSRPAGCPRGGCAR